MRLIDARSSRVGGRALTIHVVAVQRLSRNQSRDARTDPGQQFLQLAAAEVVDERAQTTFKTIRDLNPELRGYYIPDGSYTLFIPSKNSDKFLSRLNARIEESQDNKTR